MSRKIPDKLDISKGLIGNENLEYNYIYCLKDIYDAPKYIGVTKNITTTKNRHFGKCVQHELSFSVLGMFYDRSLAEYIEIKIIEKLNSEGINTINIVDGHK